MREALAAAGRMPLERVVVIGEAADGAVVFSADDGEPMTGKTLLWMLERAKHLLLGG